MNLKEMREDLENWLAESRLRNGTWTKEQKDRQLNDACLKFVTKTKHLRGLKTITSVKDQARYELPEGFLDFEYIFLEPTVGASKDNRLLYEIESFSMHTRLSHGLIDIRPVETYRYAFVEEDEKNFSLNPAPADDGLEIELVYIKKPNKLINPGDVSNINEAFHEAMPAYAAYKMLPKEFEGTNRARVAQVFWFEKLAEETEEQNKYRKNNSNVGRLGPEFRSTLDSVSRDEDFRKFRH